MPWRSIAFANLENNKMFFLLAERIDTAAEETNGRTKNLNFTEIKTNNRKTKNGLLSKQKNTGEFSEWFVTFFF